MLVWNNFVSSIITGLFWMITCFNQLFPGDFLIVRKTLPMFSNGVMYLIQIGDIINILSRLDIFLNLSIIYRQSQFCFVTKHGIYHNCYYCTDHILPNFEKIQ